MKGEVQVMMNRADFMTLWELLLDVQSSVMEKHRWSVISEDLAEMVLFDYSLRLSRTQAYWVWHRRPEGKMYVYKMPMSVVLALYSYELADVQKDYWRRRLKGLLGAGLLGGDLTP